MISLSWVRGERVRSRHNMRRARTWPVRRPRQELAHLLTSLRYQDSLDNISHVGADEYLNIAWLFVHDQPEGAPFLADNFDDVVLGLDCRTVRGHPELPRFSTNNQLHGFRHVPNKLRIAKKSRLDLIWRAHGIPEKSTKSNCFYKSCSTSTSISHANCNRAKLAGGGMPSCCI